MYLSALIPVQNISLHTKGRSLLFTLRIPWNNTDSCPNKETEIVQWEYIMRRVDYHT